MDCFASLAMTNSMTPRTATLIGLTAILMWSLLSVLTVATGKIPAFQLAAMTFAIGALVAFASFAVPARRRSARCKQPLAAWVVGVGGLFGYHALYFLALRFAPPAEAGLLNYLWPLLIVLFSSLLPGERLAPHHIIGALLGLAGTVLLFAGSGARLRAGPDAGLAAAFVAAFVWAAYSVMSRKLKAVPTDAVAGFCLATALLAALVHGLVETTVWPETVGAVARDHRARRRPGRRRVLRLGHRHEARRHPRARRGVLRDAAALDRVSDPRGLCAAERDDRASPRC